jgi:hypothetical protein
MSAASDPPNLDYTSILKPWVLRRRKWLGGIAGVVFLLVFLAVACPYVSRTGPVGLGVRIIFAFWTIAVPVWFFIESVYGVDDTKAFEPDFKSRKDDLKAMQEAARSVWAGCAAAVAVLLWKLGE